MSIQQQTLKQVTFLCRDAILHKIMAAASYGVRAYIYQGSSVADMELNSAQCLLLALLHSLVLEDIMSCCLLADVCHHLRQLRSDYLRVWLAGDFVFPRQDMEKAFTFLSKLSEAGTLKLPAHLTRIMSTLATKYRIQLISPSTGGRGDIAVSLEEAVINDMPGDILALACEGVDINGSTQSGDSLVHLAARLGNCASIAALGFLKANLDSSNSSNATPLEEAIRNNCGSSTKALLLAGAKTEIRFIRGNTYLHLAAAGGYNGALEALLEVGIIDVNRKNYAEETPLFVASRARNVRGVELLLEKGADAEIVPGGSKSLLEIAVESEDIEMLKVLLRFGADLKKKDGDTLFHLVVRCGNIAMFKVIQEMSLPENCRNQDELTPLHLASDPYVINTLIRKGLGADDRTGKGETALYLASARGSLELVRALYEGGAAVDAQDNAGTSALMIALKNTKVGVATFLLHKGADPNIKDNEGRTALHYAAEGGSPESVTTLLNAGARVNEKDSKGDTPAFIAAENNKTAVLRLLVENGADLAARDSSGDGMLHRAARSGQVEAVAALIDAGAEVDARGWDQYTALHWAALRGHTAVVAALLDRGVDLAARNSDGDTPLILASYLGRLGAVQLLVGRGAEVNAKTNDGRTALGLANTHKHTAVADYLRSRGGVQ